MFVTDSDIVWIKNIWISNFRTFPPLDIDSAEPTVSNLAKINIFVGPNGAGKTNFFNAIRHCLNWHSFNSQVAYTIEQHYRNESQPIEVRLEFDVSGRSQNAWLKQPARAEYKNTNSIERYPAEDDLKWRAFPIGLPRKFKEYNDIEREGRPRLNYDGILSNWRRIRQDAKEFLDLDLPEKAPTKPAPCGDRFFYDVHDSHGRPILDSSDGVANFLFMIIGIRIMPHGSALLIEEPEVSMHPSMQKRFLDYLEVMAKTENHQFLISTHSPYLMNLASGKDDAIALFRVAKDDKGQTSIGPVNADSQSWELLTDLGHSPADVLQANGVVWVEGPSDLIYLTCWLEKLAPGLVRGKDYEVMWYGGSNFVHLLPDESQRYEDLWQHKKTKDKLIALFNLNPNWAFLVDSDSDKTSIPKTTQQNKESFLKECGRLGKFARKVEPDIEQCIIDYKEWTEPLSASKPDRARRYIERFRSKAVDLSDHLKASASALVTELADEIRKWCQVVVSDPS